MKKFYVLVISLILASCCEDVKNNDVIDTLSNYRGSTIVGKEVGILDFNTGVVYIKQKINNKFLIEKVRVPSSEYTSIRVGDTIPEDLNLLRRSYKYYDCIENYTGDVVVEKEILTNSNNNEEYLIRVKTYLFDRYIIKELNVVKSEFDKVTVGSRIR